MFQYKDLRIERGFTQIWRIKKRIKIISLWSLTAGSNMSESKINVVNDFFNINPVPIAIGTGFQIRKYPLNLRKSAFYNLF